MAKTKHKTPYAIDKDGEHFFVKLKYCGIHILVILADGLPVTFFGNNRTPYIEVKQAINWHEKELRETGGRSGNQSVLNALQQAQNQFEARRIVENGIT